MRSSYIPIVSVQKIRTQRCRYRGVRFSLTYEMLAVFKLGGSFLHSVDQVAHHLAQTNFGWLYGRQNNIEQALKYAWGRKRYGVDYHLCFPNRCAVGSMTNVGETPG